MDQLEAQKTDLNRVLLWVGPLIKSRFLVSCSFRSGRAALLAAQEGNGACGHHRLAACRSHIKAAAHEVDMTA